MNRKKTIVNAYARMRPKQLAEATAEFEQEMVVKEFLKPSRVDRASWERARRKPGRPRQGRGARVISASIEQDLLARSDALAKTLGITRAALIARGLKAVLAAEGRT